MSTTISELVMVSWKAPEMVTMPTMFIWPPMNNWKVWPGSVTGALPVTLPLESVVNCWMVMGELPVLISACMVPVKPIAELP
jgi:hypothetical protein